MNKKDNGHDCPCCGRPLISAGVSVDMARNLLVSPDGEMQLTLHEADVLYVLIDANRPLKLPMFMGKVYGQGEEPEAGGESIRAALSRTRKRALGIGVVIGTGFYAGYTIRYAPDEAADILRKRLGTKGGDSPLYTC
jgi:DNA-binding response OmpR family regulator